jgi:hypothetical protein
VRKGDTLVLTGCSKDEECDFAQECVRDPSATASVSTGLCLDRATEQKAKQERLNACSPLLRAVREFRITSAKQGVEQKLTGELSDELRLAEIWAPPHRAETRTCAADEECKDVRIATKDSSKNTVQLATSCRFDDAFGAGARRCVRTCRLPTDMTLVTPTDDLCPPDFQCLRTTSLSKHTQTLQDEATAEIAQRQAEKSAAQAELATTTDPVRIAQLQAQIAGLDSRVQDRTRYKELVGREGVCVRAPLEDGYLKNCLREVQSYEIHAGDAFIVTGSVSGFIATSQANPMTKECETPPVSSPYVRLRQPRIPVELATLPQCLSTAEKMQPIEQRAHQPWDAITPPAAPEANVCYYDDEFGSASIIHFENPFLAVGVKMPKSLKVPQEKLALAFDVVGGGFPITAILQVSDVAQQPRSAVSAPDGQFIYIVDEGKSSAATGLRGQLFRLNTASLTVDRTFVVR